MPVLQPQSLEFISRSAEQTRRAGMRLGRYYRPEIWSAWSATWERARRPWCRASPAAGARSMRLPARLFVLVNVYRRLDGKRLFHLDAYRLSGAAEAEDLDLDALLETGSLVIEWADHIEETLPKERLWITFSWINDEQRDMVFTANGSRYQILLGQLRRQVFGVS